VLVLVWVLVPVRVLVRVLVLVLVPVPERRRVVEHRLAEVGCRSSALPVCVSRNRSWPSTVQ